jgi:hypothetical protein
MARTSAYVIVLGEAERVELEHRVACYTLAYKVVVRAKIGTSLYSVSVSERRSPTPQP